MSISVVTIASASKKWMRNAPPQPPEMVAASDRSSFTRSPTPPPPSSPPADARLEKFLVEGSERQDVSRPGQAWTEDHGVASGGYSPTGREGPLIPSGRGCLDWPAPDYDEAYWKLVRSVSAETQQFNL